MFIRQGSTHKVLIGPVVAVSDGFTPITTLALTTADEAEALVHDSATVVDISGYTFTAVASADGYYVLTLQSAISNTVGHLTILINDDSLCLPVKAEFTVIEEAVYDAYYASGATGVPALAALEATAGRLTEALATQLVAHSLGVGRGVADAGSSTTSLVFKTVNGVAADATDDHYNGRHVVFTSGVLFLQAVSITDYDGASTTATISTATDIPAEDVTFIIV